MSGLLALADLAGKTEAEIKEHIVENYRSAEGDYPYEEAEKQLRLSLHGAEILVAYESVGSWGCDSASFFLARNDGKLYENNASHCSCFGFEGQWEPEEAVLEAMEKRDYFSMGGYDNESDANQASIKAYISSLLKPTEQAGHLQEQDLIEEIAEAIWVSGVTDDRNDGDWYRKEIAKVALSVLRKRHLLTEQAIEMLGEGK